MYTYVYMYTYIGGSVYVYNIYNAYNIHDIIYVLYTHTHTHIFHLQMVPFYFPKPETRNATLNISEAASTDYNSLELTHLHTHTFFHSRHLCRPAGLAKKLKTCFVVECMTASHLQHALGMSKAQATSFVQAYYANEDVRFDRSEMDEYDKMLLQRSQQMIGRTRTQNLLGADKQEVEAKERQTQLQSKMDSLEQKVSTRLQEMQEQMQEQHTKLLAALQPLMRTTLHTQGSTSAPQTSSAAYVGTGQPDAVYTPPVPPPNGYGITDGQGTRNEEPNPPPRRASAYVSGGDREGVESVSVFPADLVFWR